MPSILYYWKRLKYAATGVIKLKTPHQKRGDVLLSYITLPFIKDIADLSRHTNYWECRKIAEVYLDKGFDVDVIDWQDKTFVPTKPYSIFIDIHENLKRLSPCIGSKCLKVMHITGAHWRFMNNAEQERLNDLKNRRGVSLVLRRSISPVEDIEYADVATILGNAFTLGTYAYANKKMFPIHLSTTHTFPFLDNKNIENARRRYVWFGGAGMVHKGLDRALEVFAALPDYHLTVCGPVESEPDFVEAYRTELYKTKNISVVGKIDPGSEQFKDIIETHIGLIHPSCSEGQSGGVITCMHAGLIPVVSYESGVDVEDFGTVLTTSSLEEIKNAVVELSGLPATTLMDRSKKAWNYAQTHHTREKFAEEYEAAADAIIALVNTKIH